MGEWIALHGAGEFGEIQDPVHEAGVLTTRPAREVAREFPHQVVAVGASHKPDLGACTSGIEESAIASVSAVSARVARP